MAEDMACETHDIETLPTGYDRCPLCEEEARIQSERQHLMTRDRRVEPW